MFGRWAKEYKKSAVLGEYNPQFIIKLGPVFNVIFTFGNLLVLYYVAAVNHVSAADYMAFTYPPMGLVGQLIMALANITSVISEVKPAMEMVETNHDNPCLEVEAQKVL